MTYDNTQLATFSDDELITFYANAYETSDCIGHIKHAQNKRAMQRYAAELAKRGVTEIPERVGIYNGEGSY